MGSLVQSLCSVLLVCAPVAYDDSRSGWPGYDWQQVPLSACLRAASAPCPLFQGKWDWKRPQFVDLVFVSSGGSLGVRETLTNNDRADDDDVCVTALFQNDKGENVGVFHLNVHSWPKQTADFKGQVVQAAGKWSNLASVWVGTKQCRKGPTEDAAVYKAVVAALRE
jgi:hypothetical protein